MTYGPRACVICGREFIPYRTDQKTCGDPACVKKNQSRAWRKYRETHKEERRQQQRDARERKKAAYQPKLDTIVAIGYADRQRASTLQMAGKVRTEL